MENGSKIEYVGIAEIAKLTGYSLYLSRQFVKMNKIPFKMFGKHKRYDKQTAKEIFYSE